MTRRPVPAPTDRELHALAVYADTGDLDEAARRLEMTGDALRGLFARWRRREGVSATVTLVYRYRDRMAA